MPKSHVYHFGLIGFPIGHSLSPALHHAALQYLGLTGRYHLFPISPFPDGKKNLWALLAELKTGNLNGLNVTIPHKQNVIPYLDVLSDTAQAIGAVNTISRHGAKLVGDNTDAPGFLLDLKKFLDGYTTEIESKDALILGAGGSARAVCYALMQGGWTVTIASRRKEQGEKLVEDLSAQAAILLNEEDIGKLNPGLIVNTTPLGMYPNGEVSPWPTDLPFPENTVVYDLVYRPVKTKLMQDASEIGYSCTNGLGMLIEQARLSFQLWSGMTVPREVMESSIHAYLVKENS
jgi:shikimate dehydrogenase